MPETLIITKSDENKGRNEVFPDCDWHKERKLVSKRVSSTVGDRIVRKRGYSNNSHSSNFTLKKKQKKKNSLTSDKKHSAVECSNLIGQNRRGWTSLQ